MPIDYLIIGQGLAGSLLGWELIRRGQRIMLVDNGMENASRIAAGLINPVTGKRIVKTCQIDVLLPTALDYYAALERFFQQKFYIDKPMLRLLRNDKERQTAEKRLAEPGYSDYLAGLIEAKTGLNSSHGLLQQAQTGYLLTQPLLMALRQFFIEQGSYRHSVVDYREIRLEPEPSWQNWRPRRIIFCEGYRAIDNPWFSWLPFQPVKGRS
nr:FAD-dependent oxidoreductase [Methylomarinum sp. Ch1-1]MDP4521363.1 hypothetical protein [Methylomarinum sp. Ch1-1]